MYNIKLIENKKILKSLAILAIVITIIGFIADLQATFDYPGTDLRNRVVGARLTLEGIDPYFFKWQPELPESFYDPLDKPAELMSKLSVPPTILVLHSIFAGLSYLQQKIVWLVVQWAAFLGTVIIFLKTAESPLRKKLVLIISFFFANSLFWRFHISSGQVYIVYVFLLSIAWMLLHESMRFNEFYSGFFVGITTSFRPSFILFSIPFLIGRKINFVLGNILGLLSSVSLSLLLFGTLIWQKYILSMLVMIGALSTESHLIPDNRVSIASDINYPKIVEGFNSSLGNPFGTYLDNTSFYYILNVLDISNKKNILAAGFLLFIVLFSLYVFYSFSKNKNIDYLFLLGVLVCLIGDFFIPVGRYSYYDIQMILPLLLLATRDNIEQLIRNRIILVVLSGLILSSIGFVVIPRALFFSVFLILSSIICASFNYANQNAYKSRS